MKVEVDVLSLMNHGFRERKATLQPFQLIPIRFISVLRSYLHCAPVSCTKRRESSVLFVSFSQSCFFFFPSPFSMYYIAEHTSGTVSNLDFFQSFFLFFFFLSPYSMHYIVQYTSRTACNLVFVCFLFCFVFVFCQSYFVFFLSFSMYFIVEHTSKPVSNFVFTPSQPGQQEQTSEANYGTLFFFLSFFPSCLSVKII